MSIRNSAPERNIRTNWTIVRTLSSWISVVWPSKRLFREFRWCRNKCIFLFNTIPGIFFCDVWVVPDFFRKVSKVCVCRHQLLTGIIFPVPSFTHNQDIVSTSEWVPVEGYRLKNNFTLISHSLVRAATIVVPLRDISYRFNWSIKCSGFRSECDTRAVDPNVFCNNFTKLIDVKKVLSVLIVQIVFVWNHLRN